MGRLITGLKWVVILVLNFVESDGVPCKTDKDCKADVEGQSTCHLPAGLCGSNPYEQGCLFRHGVSDKKRVCNSEDLPNAVEKGLCRKADIEYPEVRLFANDWESAIFETWILQIILSELLDVPTTTETGVYGSKIDFYNPHNAFDFGNSNYTDSMANSALLKDCRKAMRSASNYEPCAHVITEIWQADGLSALRQSGIAEPAQPLGVLGQEGWFIPKFTGQRDPTLLSYMGLQGEKNRRKLAATFLRPTSWGDYCEEVSNSSCSHSDDVATRAPYNEFESSRYFVEGMYSGYFRKTEENDCEKWPTNCTGHFIDYPCGWTSTASQVLYHLKISLKSGGDQISGGYEYRQMVEIVKAANHTKSNVIMMWWYPSTIYQHYLGTDTEFMKVNLPPPTQSCMVNRVTVQDQCSSDLLTRVGNASGACDEAAKPLFMVLSAGLRELNEDNLIPIPLRSPAERTLEAFQMSGIQLSEIFRYWREAEDPREGICQWILNNRDWAHESIPRGYPRRLQESKVWGILRSVALGLSVMAIIATLISLLVVVHRRQSRVMVFAQMDFLLLTLVGLLLVGLGALTVAIPPTNATCIMTVWFVYIGYTLELIPLCTKISIINRLIHSSPTTAMPRIEVSRKSLFNVLGFVGVFVLIFLFIWSIEDPPQDKSVFEFDRYSTASKDGLIVQFHYCASTRLFWSVISLVWNTMLLGCATVLAFQSRHIRQDFNESHTLALMIYSHFVFIILRIFILLFLPGTANESVLALCQSIILSTDTLATLVIYFLPKFLTSDESHRRASSQALKKVLPRSHFEIWNELDSSELVNPDKGILETEFIERERRLEEIDDAPEDIVHTQPQRRVCQHCGLDPDCRDLDAVDKFCPAVVPKMLECHASRMVSAELR